LFLAFVPSLVSSFSKGRNKGGDKLPKINFRKGKTVKYNSSDNYSFGKRTILPFCELINYFGGFPCYY